MRETTRTFFLYSPTLFFPLFSVEPDAALNSHVVAEEISYTADEYISVKREESFPRSNGVQTEISSRSNEIITLIVRQFSANFGNCLYLSD